MKVYLDFDGVILDTDSVLDKDYSKTIKVDRKEFIKNYDWDELLKKSEIIANSLDNIKKSKYDISILSKISSMKEGIAKIKYLRDNDIYINVHLVPSEVSKSAVVDPKGNILIYDKIYNLEQWEQNGGTSIFFNKNNLNFDIYNKENKKYPKINNLEILLTDQIK